MLHPVQGGAVPKGVPSQHQGVLRDVLSQGKYVPGVSHPRSVTSQECHIPYWDVPRNILLALGCQDGDPGDGDTPQGDATHRMICLSGLILSGLIVPGAGMPGPPLCGSTGTLRVPATDRILSLAGSGSELEENGKSGSKKLDTMTLIKEGELLSGVKPSILGLCEPSSWDPCLQCSQQHQLCASLLNSPHRHGHLWALPCARRVLPGLSLIHI